MKTQFLLLTFLVGLVACRGSNSAVKSDTRSSQLECKVQVEMKGNADVDSEKLKQKVKKSCDSYASSVEALIGNHFGLDIVNTRVVVSADAAAAVETMSGTMTLTVNPEDNIGETRILVHQLAHLMMGHPRKREARANQSDAHVWLKEAIAEAIRHEVVNEQSRCDENLYTTNLSCGAALLRYSKKLSRRPSFLKLLNDASLNGNADLEKFLFSTTGAYSFDELMNRCRKEADGCTIGEARACNTSGDMKLSESNSSCQPLGVLDGPTEKLERLSLTDKQ